MKKILCTVLVVWIAVILQISAGAEDAYINFPDEGKFITAASKNAETVECLGVSGWKIPITGICYINCKVDNDCLYNVSGESMITVNYFDDEEGKFCIQYSDVNNDVKYSDTVNLLGSKTWKTHSFELSDCAYNDGVLGNDFRITLQDSAGRSSVPVVFAGVSVDLRKLYISAKTEKTGNAFIDTENTEVKTVVDNLGNNEISCTITAVVYNTEKKAILTKTTDVLVPGNGSSTEKIVFDGLPNGLYSAEITVTDGTEIKRTALDFSVSKTVTGNCDSIFGTCLHVNGLGKDTEKLQNTIEMVKKAGIDWIRDEYYWDHVEKEKGVYNFYADDYINLCVENNINPLIILDYSNSLYGGVPHDEEGYAGFAAYAKAVASHLKGKVKYYEVWNEWNGGTWNGGYGIEEYANILKYTYEALKEVDPDIQVVAGATIMAAVSWFDSLFGITKDGKSMYEYCDAISYHPYCFPYSPDNKREGGNVEDNFMNMYNMMSKYGTPKPQLITEYGWFTGTAAKSVSQEVQAQYISRAYICGMAYGVDKIFMYDFKNDGADLNNSEHNYGIIGSWDESEEIKYRPKLSFLATAAAAQLLKKTEFVKGYRPRENIRMYRFQNTAQNREVYAVYSADNSTVPFILTGNNLKLKCYDIFGNECNVKEINGAPIYIEGSIGEFNIDGFVTEFRSKATATFGKDYKYDGISVVGYEKPDTAGKRNAYAISSSDKTIVCDIDDTWINTERAEIKLSVDYYDSGTGSFYIEYKSLDGSTNKTDIINLEDSGNFKTAEFVLNDINMSNAVENGDFKITSDSLANAVKFFAVRAEGINSGNPVIAADFENSDFKNLNSITGNYTAYFDGMSVMAGNNSNGDFKYVEKSGRYGVYVPAVNDGYYLQVNIDDDILYGGLNDITISVDYFDEGNGNFDIAYDKGVYSFQYPTTNVVYLHNTKTWKTATFRLNESWLENHGTDFRIALWTGWMSTSTEGITFGGIRIKDNKEKTSFYTEYDEITNNVKISGYFQSTSDEPVSIQILKAGADASELSTADNSNVNNIVRYISQAQTTQVQEYRYFEKQFNMNDSTGAYIARVRYPGETTVIEKYLYYYNLYDVNNIIFYDKNGQELSHEQLTGVDYLDISADFVSNYDDTDVCMAAAVYDSDGKMYAVDMIEASAVAGDTNALKASVLLPRKIQSGDKIKIFMLKNISGMIPISAAEFIKAK